MKDAGIYYNKKTHAEYFFICKDCVGIVPGFPEKLSALQAQLHKRAFPAHVVKMQT